MGQWELHDFTFYQMVVCVCLKDGGTEGKNGTHGEIKSTHKLVVRI
jgi:hypothetical protein